MDFVNKIKDKVGGGSQESHGGAQKASGSGGQQQKDYGDKAFDFVAQKTGHKLDPSTSEKITDGARGLYEKQTGKKVDPKYSN